MKVIAIIIVIGLVYMCFIAGAAVNSWQTGESMQAQSAAVVAEAEAIQQQAEAIRAQSETIGEQSDALVDMTGEAVAGYKASLTTVILWGALIIMVLLFVIIKLVGSGSRREPEPVGYQIINPDADRYYVDSGDRARMSRRGR